MALEPTEEQLKALEMTLATGAAFHPRGVRTALFSLIRDIVLEEAAKACDGMGGGAFSSMGHLVDHRDVAKAIRAMKGTP